MAKDIDKEIEELESQVKQELEGDSEPPETEDTPPVEESEEVEVEDSAAEPDEQAEVEVETCQECERLKTELETANKRVRDTQSHMHAVTTEASRLRKEVDALKSDKAKLEGKLEALQSDPKEESQIEELYPEVASELKKRDAQIETFSEKIARLEKEKNDDEERRRNDDGVRALKMVRDAHPDSTSIIPTDDFQDWVKSHRYRNHIVATLDAPPTLDTVDDVIAIISEFKESKTPAKEDPVEKAKKVAAPKLQNKARKPDIKPKEGKRYSYAELQKMKPEEYAKISDDVDLAFTENRIDP